MSVLGSYQGSNVIIKVNQKGFAKTNIRLGSEHLETRWSLTTKRRTPFLQNRWNGNLINSPKNVTIEEIVFFVVIPNEYEYPKNIPKSQ